MVIQKSQNSLLFITFAAEINKVKRYTFQHETNEYRKI